jgi:hypothetical protein
MFPKSYVHARQFAVEELPPWFSQQPPKKDLVLSSFGCCSNWGPERWGELLKFTQQEGDQSGMGPGGLIPAPHLFTGEEKAEQKTLQQRDSYQKCAFGTMDVYTCDIIVHT